MRYFQVDVFAAGPFTGNGVGVFPEAADLTTEQMQILTQELRQFECIFLARTGEAAFRARIFTVEEELPFAGHPLLGAGAVLHHLSGGSPRARWTLMLAGGRPVEVRSERQGEGFRVEMEQGQAVFGPPVDGGAVLAALGLGPEALVPELPIQMVSTGLPYLVIPLLRGLEGARIRHDDFEALLARHQTKFVYLLDVAAREGRTWDNRGMVEDVATGSAAGPAAAYLVRHGRARAGEWLLLRQGRFAGRPSELGVRMAESGEVTVRGSAFVIAEGRLVRHP